MNVTPRRDAPKKRPSLRTFPPHVAVLVVAGLLGVFLAARAGATLELAHSSAEWSAEQRAQVVSALAFNAALALGFLVFLVGDAIATAWALFRHGGLRRLALRSALCLLPSMLWATAQLILNPWLLTLGRQARRWLG